MTVDIVQFWTGEATVEIVHSGQEATVDIVHSGQEATVDIVHLGQEATVEQFILDRRRLLNSLYWTGGDS